MTYQPRNPGYSTGPQPPAGYGPSAVRPPDARGEGSSKLPVYLRGAVVVLGHVLTDRACKHQGNH